MHERTTSRSIRRWFLVATPIGRLAGLTPHGEWHGSLTKELLAREKVDFMDIISDVSTPDLFVRMAAEFQRHVKGVATGSDNLRKLNETFHF